MDGKIIATANESATAGRHRPTGQRFDADAPDVGRAPSGPSRDVLELLGADASPRTGQASIVTCPGCAATRSIHACSGGNRLERLLAELVTA